MFQEVFGDDLPIAKTGGEVRLTLTADGEATLTYDDVHVVFEEGVAPFATLYIRGGGDLMWRGGTPGWLTFEGQSFEFAAEAGGMAIPIDSEGFPLGRTEVRYNVGAAH